MTHTTTIPKAFRKKRKSFGKRLRESMKTEQISNRELATALGIRKHYTMISCWTQGTSPIPVWYWLGLAEELGVPKEKFVMDALSTDHPDIYAILEEIK